MSKEKENSTHKKRPPVVAVLGHVDHGKSSLLDYIRKSNIIDSEHGGITQHLGAYETTWIGPDKIEQKITFLDTPGHESFCSMRRRGVCLSDIAILIVSAEESVKAQTIEAKNSIEESGIPYMVAINKIDRPSANPEKVKQDLAENGTFLESYGGKIPSVNISAKTGEGIDELLDVLLLMADMEDLKGNPQAPAEGFILENNLDPKTGISATLVIKNGSLKNGDWLAVAGQAFKIKKIEDDQGQTLKKASFSSPIKILGWKELPPVGEPFTILKDKKEADDYEKNFVKCSKGEECSLAEENETDKKIIPLIIKTDVEGTLEAIVMEIKKINNKDNIKLNIIKSGVGSIGEDDVKTAQTKSETIIIGFNIKTDKAAADIIERTGVEIQIFSIIYKLKEWLEDEMEKRRPRITIEKVVGQAKILKVFNKQKSKQLIGGNVISGYIVKKGQVNIIRRDNLIGQGIISELQQQKLEAIKVEEGNQFGAKIETKIDLVPGDVIEMFEKVIS